MLCSVLWGVTQRGGEMFPKDDNGQLIYDDIHFIETWKVRMYNHGPRCVMIMGIPSFVGITFNPFSVDPEKLRLGKSFHSSVPQVISR